MRYTYTTAVEEQEKNPARAWRITKQGSKSLFEVILRTPEVIGAMVRISTLCKKQHVRWQGRNSRGDFSRIQSRLLASSATGKSSDNREKETKQKTEDSR